ncbi:MAG: hypothetical protein JXA54_06765 [Candidatus Heimdallarchaeota archaeon]|nr:hypothetical protein [Candidatus Heimdallarchaeota archaeon]
MNERDIFEDIKLESKKYNLSNYQDGFKFFIKIMRKHMPNFPTDKIVKLYNSFFDKYNITLFNRIENLPAVDKNNSYIYFFNETMLIGSQLLSISSRINDKNENSKEIKELIKLLFGGKNSDILLWYWREYEVQYNNFVKPSFMKLNLRLPRNDNSPKRERQINGLKNELSKNPNYKVFTIFLESLNTSLRNAIAHLDYYIDDDTNEVFYFTYKQDLPIKNQSTIEEIIKKLFFLLLAKLFMIVYLCDKFK